MLGGTRVDKWLESAPHCKLQSPVVPTQLWILQCCHSVVSRLGSISFGHICSGFL